MSTFIVTPSTTRSAFAAVLSRFQNHAPTQALGFAVNVFRKNYGFIRRSDAKLLHAALSSDRVASWSNVPTMHGACNTQSLTHSALIGAYAGIIAQNTGLLSEKQRKTLLRALGHWVDLQRHF